MRLKHLWRASASAAVLALALAVTSPRANAMSLEEAMAIAVESNPEIGQAIENREAVEFELRQARGLYLPSVDLEASAGQGSDDHRQMHGPRLRKAAALLSGFARRPRPGF